MYVFFLCYNLNTTDSGNKRELLYVILRIIFLQVEAGWADYKVNTNAYRLNNYCTKHCIGKSW